MPETTAPSLAERLSGTVAEAYRLPLILCGPILRRTERNQVNVWVALREQRNLRLEVYPQAPGDPLLTGEASTVALGAHLHVAVITATPKKESDQLQWGGTYRYNVLVGENPTAKPTLGLLSPGILADDATDAKKLLTYQTGPALPSFQLFPEKLADVRLLHGSARRIGGAGQDALAVMDHVLQGYFLTAGEKRPHALILTGDQIFADGVPDVLMPLLTQAGEALLGYKEAAWKAKELRPGRRLPLAKEIGLLSDTDGDANHLLQLGEYYAMYLHAWSNVLWPETLPTLESLFTKEELKERPTKEAAFKAAAQRVEAFRMKLAAVRRLMANIPVYTVLGEHDIALHFNMTRRFGAKVYSNALGRRLIRNGLLAYAVFQDWGNAPDRYASADPAMAGALALQAALQRSPESDDGPDHDLLHRLRVPQYDANGQEVTAVPPDVYKPELQVHWHYRLHTAAFDLLALDTRTERVFPAPPMLDGRSEPLPESSLKEQIGIGPEAFREGATIVATAGPVLGAPFTDGLQAFISGAPAVTPTYADGWTFRSHSYERMLAELAARSRNKGTERRFARVLFLSSAPYSFAAHLDYWGNQPYSGFEQLKPADGAYAELTAGPLCHQTYEGLRPASSAGARRQLKPRRIFGWATAPDPGALVEMTPAAEAPADADDLHPVIPGPPFTVNTESATWQIKLKQDEQWKYVVTLMRDPTVTSVDPQPPLLPGGMDTSLVGFNAASDVRFTWSAAKKEAVQRLWWQDDANMPVKYQVERAVSLDLPGRTDPALLYGGYNLQRGDKDATKLWGGKTRSAAAGDLLPATGQKGFVEQLQADLRELGFLMVDGDTKGVFDRFTEWGVREFQIYAKMTDVAEEDPTKAEEKIYADKLQRADNPEAERYTGPISGVVNVETAGALQVWKSKKFRCPVVVEQWEVNNKQERIKLLKPNIWRYDEAQSGRMFVRDFTRYYTFPETRSTERDGRNLLGRWGSAADCPGGPLINPSQTWNPEGELLPEALTGQTLDELVSQAARLSTYKVVRAVSEVECTGFFDCINAWDNAIISQGPCHWTLGLRNEAHTAWGSAELGGFLAYVQYAEPQAFEQAVGFFGLRPVARWAAADGTASGQAMFNADERKYATWIEMQAEPADGTDGTAMRYLPWRTAIDDGNWFKSWHWTYRFAMAGRTIDGYRRRMWDMARVRMRDFLRAEVDGVQTNDPVAGKRLATIGEIFTSERAVGLLLRWHIKRPANVINDGKANWRIRDAVKAANLTGDPSTWTDDNEKTLIEKLDAAQKAVDDTDLHNTMKMVMDWPAYTDRASLRYTLDKQVEELKKTQPDFAYTLSNTRNSFQFDEDDLPTAPDYTFTPPEK